MRSRYGMDLTEGSIFKKMIIFCIPVILTSILQQLFNTADQIVAGRLIGDNALASVGSTSTLYNLLINFFIGLSTGTTVTCAKHKGAGNDRKVTNSVSTGISLALISGAIIFTVGQSFCRQLLVATAVPSYLEGFAALYMRVIFIGTPFQLLYNFSAGILRASGDTKRPLYILTAAGMINVALNLILVLILPESMRDKRVIGVAIGTVASHLFSSITVLSILIRSSDCFRLELKKLKIHKEHLFEILKVGMPAGISSVAFSMANVVIQSNVNMYASREALNYGIRYSSYQGINSATQGALSSAKEPFKAGVVVSGIHAANNIDSYLSLMIAGWAVGVVSFTGQNYGAKKYGRIDKTVICAMTLAVIALSIPAIPLLIDSKLFLSIFTETESAIRFGSMKVSLLAWAYALYIPLDMLGAALRGVEHSTVPLALNLIFVFGARLIWVFFFYPLDPTLTMLYVAYPLSWGLSSVAHFIAYLTVRRKLRKNLPEEAVHNS